MDALPTICPDPRDCLWLGVFENAIAHTKEILESSEISHISVFPRPNGVLIVVLAEGGSRNPVWL